MTMAMKEPIKEPEARWQKSVNWLHMEFQLAELFPLCARNSIADAADAADISSASVTLHNIQNTISINTLLCTNCKHLQKIFLTN